MSEENSVTTPNPLQVEIDGLVELLEKADEAYYVNDNPIIPDSDYDNLVAYYKQLTGKAWMKLGKPSPLLTRIPHIEPMLSLLKANTLQELADFVEPHPDDTLYVLTPKIDGCSNELRFDTGHLALSVSRGDGTVGEGTTTAVMPAIRAGHIPGSAPDDPTIRGEVYIPHALFPLVGGKNPRNSAAGLLRRQTADAKQEHLRFCAYRILGSTASYEVDLMMLQNWGFETPPFVLLSKAELLAMSIEDLHPASWADELPYEIDGVVIAIDSPKLRDQLGMTSSHPRWACAFKFATEEKRARIIAVDWSPSRTGPQVPTYIFEAVELCGTTVNRATGHNIDQFRKLGAGPGTEVMVKKCGEIIPRVDRLAEGQTRHPEIDALHPTTCTSCGSRLIIKSVHLMCANLTCPEKLIGQLEYAGNRENLDINGLGESVCEALVKTGLVSCLTDLFRLTDTQLAGMSYQKSVYGETRAKKLIAQIEKAKTKPWNIVLHSLGVPGLGTPQCNAIAERYSLEQLGCMPTGHLKMELITMKNIGDITAIDFVDWLKLSYNWVFDLIGILQTEPVKVDLSKQKLLGYTVVVTGAFSTPKARKEYEKKLVELGAKVGSSVSSKTNFVVVGGDGAESNSKYQDALKLGVKIVDEAFLAKLIRENS